MLLIHVATYKLQSKHNVSLLLLLYSVYSLTLCLEKQYLRVSMRDLRVSMKDLRVSMRNRYLLLTNQITVFVTTIF